MPGPDDDGKVTEQEANAGETIEDEGATTVDPDDEGGEPTDDESAFALAFKEANSEEKPKAKEGKGDAEGEGKKDEGGKKPKEGESPKDEKEGKEDLSPEDKRAQELLDREAKAKEEAEEERKKAEDAAAEAKAKEEKEGESGKAVPLTEKEVSAFLSLLPDDELPDDLKVGDTEIDLKEFIEDFPAAKVVSGLVTQRILERLVAGGVIMTAEQHKQALQAVEQRAADAIFDLKVELKVPDAAEIIATDDFRAWLKDKATERDKVLLKSSDPNDFVMGINKYKAATGKKATSKEKKPSGKAAEFDERAAKEKKRHTDLHSETSKPAKGASESRGGGGTDDFGSAFQEALEEEEG